MPLTVERSMTGIDISYVTKLVLKNCGYKERWRHDSKKKNPDNDRYCNDSYAAISYGISTDRRSVS